MSTFPGLRSESSRRADLRNGIAAHLAREKGFSQGGAATLEESRNGVTSIHGRAGSKVDAKLRDLRWGIPEPVAREAAGSAIELPRDGTVSTQADVTSVPSQS
jgi:hypothetical protein